MTLVFGIVLPSVLFGVVGGNRLPDEESQLSFETEQTTTGAQDPFLIPVETDAGVVTMELQEYLVGVLLCEMPWEFEVEALKAQAVVARTYTLRGYQRRIKHPDAAVCTASSCCQGYRSAEDYLAAGGSAEAVEKMRRAVEETRDLVIIYEDKLIDATYFSCSGGMTEDALAVWGAQVPYLQSVPSPGEEAATHYTDTQTYTRKEFCTLLGISDTGGKLLGAVTYTDGGGVASVVLGGKELQGTQVRSLLSLRSTAFTITQEGDTIAVTTRGFGHRVGMSQYGAEAMAAEGKDYEQILTHYYKGVSVVEYQGLQ